MNKDTNTKVSLRNVIIFAGAARSALVQAMRPVRKFFSSSALLVLKALSAVL